MFVEQGCERWREPQNLEWDLLELNIGNITQSWSFSMVIVLIAPGRMT
jgi:hypothetical protein